MKPSDAAYMLIWPPEKKKKDVSLKFWWQIAVQTIALSLSSPPLNPPRPISIYFFFKFIWELKIDLILRTNKNFKILFLIKVLWQLQ